ncbi:MAG: S8 family peptidase [Elusimicrobiota bacterium]|nr:S8 family peptidase [Elusimicrobiota bacterium]
MIKHRLLIFILIVFAAVLPGRAADSFVSGEAIVRFRSGMSVSEVKSAAAGIDAVIKSRQKKLGIFLIESDSSSTGELVSYFRARRDVIYAVPNYIAKSFAYKLPPDYSTLAELETSQWGMSKIEAPYAWNITTGDGVLVAVLDTGMDIGHEKLADNIWNNPNKNIELEIEAPEDDDSGQDYTIKYDTHGWNFVDWTNKISTFGEHGTHVAGIVAASTSSPTSDLIGVNWNAQIMSVEVLDSVKNSGSSWQVLSGIIYAADRGADIINMSLGWPPGVEIITAMEEACEYAYSKGVLIIAAAGNDDSQIYSGGIGQPAIYRSVMAVGATTPSDSKASFSSYGDEVEISAPGYQIRSSTPGDSYASWDGTSMAAPFVTGVASLVVSVWESQGLSWTPDQVRQNLIQSVDVLGGGKNRYTGYGRLNAFTSVTNAKAVQSNTDEEEVLVYPNPFFPANGQEVQIVQPGSSSVSARRLKIYTVDGILVIDKEVINLPARWNGKNSDGKNCASGLYFFSLERDGTDKTGKITLIR